MLLEDSESLEFESVGIWYPTIVLTKQGQPYLNMNTGWKGIYITVLIGEEPRKFLFKNSGFRLTKFVLQDEDGVILLTMTTDISIKKFRNDYNVEFADDIEQYGNKEILALTVLHAANYLTRMLMVAVL